MKLSPEKKHKKAIKEFEKAYAYYLQANNEYIEHIKNKGTQNAETQKKKKRKKRKTKDV